ncbi:hypothetical protein COOONC_27816 [Cooperia oncophora]
MYVQNYKRYASYFRAPYIEDMTFEFEKCQTIEMKRSKFVIEMMFATQQVLVDLARNKKFAQLHGDLENVLRSCDENALTGDLQAWSAVNGKDAPTEWPSFKDYTESLRTIASKSGGSNSSGVILTKQIIKTDEIPGPGPTNSVSPPHSDNGKVATRSLNELN